MILHKLELTTRAFPPSRGALAEQTRRAVYIAGHLWGKAYIARPNLPPLTEWGFEHASNGLCIPLWTTIVNKDAYKNIIYSCKCYGKMACTRATCKCKGRKCVSICRCRGNCVKDNPPSDIETSDDESEDDSDDN